MEREIEIQLFHNLTIENAKINSHALTQTKEEKENILSVIFIRDPYKYFDYLMLDYLIHKKSILFTQDIINHMKEFSNTNFLHWFDTLNFIPFYNPQTFQLDSAKRLDVAIDNLRRFDYVVPYEEIDTFLTNVQANIHITVENNHALLFSLNTQKDHPVTHTLIEKDLTLYSEAIELWELVKKNNFKPLRSLIVRKEPINKISFPENQIRLQEYKGITGVIKSNTIRGWVFHKEKEEIVRIEIFKNNHLLCTVNADKMRMDLKKQHIHPTGECGFEVVFDFDVFERGDKVEVKILPDNILLPLSNDIKNFLGY